MRTKKHDPKWWAIMGLVNVLLMEIPAGLYFQAADETSRAIAALLTGGMVFVLAIADALTIVLAVTK
jgi:hypothetical protein